MKTPLKISLLLNLGLLAGLICLLVARPARVAVLPPPKVAETLPPENAWIAPPPNPVPAEAKPFRWSQLVAKDYHVYVKNLRAIGCPEPTLRAIVATDVQAAFREYARDMEDQLAQLDAASWSVQLTNWNTAEVLKRRLQELPGEETAKINELLGLPPAPAEAGAALAAAAQTSGAGDPPPAMNQRQARLAAQKQAASAGETPGSNPADAGASAPMASAAQPQTSIALPPPPNAADLPLVFQPVDPSALNLNPSQMQAVNNLRQEFAASLNGTSQNPQDPAYQQAWQQALSQSDRLLEANLGQNAFIQYWDAQWDAQHQPSLASQATPPP